jgi:hypothetical protein
MHQTARTRHPSEMRDFAHSFVGLVIAGLVMLGFGGTVYKFIAPGGWFAEIFGRSVAGGLAVLLAIIMIGACAWLLRSLVSVTQRNHYSELFVYVFAGVGLVYAVQMLMKGGV